MSKKRILTHFTDGAGLKGITDLEPDNLSVGEYVAISSISFGFGENRQFARQSGDIFLTELGPEATTGQLMMIGVFGGKQQYAIQFDAEDAFQSGVIISAGHFERSIFVVPAYSVITGEIRIVRRF